MKKPAIMRIHDFIFSYRLGYRVLRHTAFWILKFLMLTIWTLKNFFHTVPGGLAKEIPSEGIHPVVNLFVGLNLLTDMIFCYCVAYWLWPHYLMQKKYIRFALMFVTLAISLHLVRYALTDHPFILSDNITPVLWQQGLEFLRSGPMGVCVFFITLKLMKEWHLKQEEKQILSRENAQAELQLLKAQVHPHFLFNTLNSIYSFTLARSSQAADLVSKLSDMMRYMVTSGEAGQVALEKELKMIRDYIALEQVRYGSRLDLTVTITGDYTAKLVAPMLMIPFVENAFKHGAGKTWPMPWIRLIIEIKNDKLHFQLDNSKPPGHAEHNGKNGIGLTNIQKRLRLLYPDTHNLELQDLYDSFTVRLQVPLQVREVIPVSGKTTPSGKTQTLTYAR
jgi:sensor histidine kinase YesM